MEPSTIIVNIAQRDLVTDKPTTEEQVLSPTTRVIVVPLAIDPQGQVLLCRMAQNRGVFPGQWALPGGGVEQGERIEEALRREVWEELGVELASFRPAVFKDAVLEKNFADGTRRPLHMIFLVYQCALASSNLSLNDEFSEAAWFGAAELADLSLNDLTRDTLLQTGFLKDETASTRP